MNNKHTRTLSMKKAFCFLLIALGMAIMPQSGMAQSSLRTSSPVPPQVELMYVKGLRYLQNAQKTDGTYEGTYGQAPGIIGFCPDVRSRPRGRSECGAVRHRGG